MLSLPTASVADSAESATTVTVRPGPLALYGVPVARSFKPLILCARVGMSAVLHAIRVVDATGSGRGWRLAVSVVSGGRAWVHAAVSSYNGPADLRARSAGDVELAARPRTVLYALRGQGMGTTVLSAVSVRARPGVRVRFVLLAP
jgi:hypothetical protein